MSCVGAAWIEPLSVSALGKWTQSGAGKSMIPLTRQTLLSTLGYLIISVATCSLMTPITYLAPQVRHVLRQIKCTSWQSRTQGHRTYRGREVRMKEGFSATMEPSVHLYVDSIIGCSASCGIIFRFISSKICVQMKYLFVLTVLEAVDVLHRTFPHCFTHTHMPIKGSKNTRISNNTHLYYAKVYRQVVYDIKGRQQWIYLYNVL